MKRTATNVRVPWNADCISFWYIPSGTAGSTEVLSLVFWSTAIQFSIIAALTYIPTTSADLPFLCTLTVVIFWPLLLIILSKVRRCPAVVLIRIFLMISDVATSRFVSRGIAFLTQLALLYQTRRNKWAWETQETLSVLLPGLSSPTERHRPSVHRMSLT